MRSILSSWVLLPVLILAVSLSAYGASPTEKPVENVAVKYGGGDVAFLKSAGINIVLDRGGNMQLSLYTMKKPNFNRSTILNGKSQII